MASTIILPTGLNLWKRKFLSFLGLSLSKPRHLKKVLNKRVSHYHYFSEFIGLIIAIVLLFLFMPTGIARAETKKQPEKLQMVNIQDGTFLPQTEYFVDVYFSGEKHALNQGRGDREIIKPVLWSIVLLKNGEMVGAEQAKGRKGTLSFPLDLSGEIGGEEIRFEAIAYKGSLRPCEVRSRYLGQDLLGCLQKREIAVSVSANARVGYGASTYTPSQEEIISTTEGLRFPKNELLISLDKEVTRERAEEIVQSIGGLIGGYFPSTNTYQVLVSVGTEAEMESLIRLLLEMDGVLGAFPNYLFELDSRPTDLENLRDKDPTLTDAYNVVGVFDAWKMLRSLSRTYHHVDVGVIDGGMDTTHPEFSNVTYEYIGDPGADVFDIWHGTNVAGIIGAGNLSEDEDLVPGSFEMNGILSGVPDYGGKYTLRIYSTPEGVGPISNNSLRMYTNIRAAVEYLAPRSDIINMSMGLKSCFPKGEPLPIECLGITALGGLAIPLMEADLARAIASFDQTLFVVSAGNAGVDSKYTMPANLDLPNLIAVGATNLSDKRAVWNKGPGLESSNYGDSVDLAAPGIGVYAPGNLKGAYTEPLDGDDYSWSGNLDCGWLSPLLCFFGGTSSAAPMVTGTAALVMAIDNSLSPSQVKNILVKSADPISISHPDGSPHEWRRLDAAGAVCETLGCAILTTGAAGSRHVVRRNGSTGQVESIEHDLMVGISKTTDPPAHNLILTLNYNHEVFEIDEIEVSPVHADSCPSEDYRACGWIRQEDELYDEWDFPDGVVTLSLGDLPEESDAFRKSPDIYFHINFLAYFTEDNRPLCGTDLGFRVSWRADELDPDLSDNEVVGYGTYDSGLDPINCPASSKIVYLDTFEPSNDGIAGPVSSTDLLNAGKDYLVTVSGTWSAWYEHEWSSYCGEPDDWPTIPSSGIQNGKVGIDVAYVFAAPTKFTWCGKPDGPPWKRNRDLEVSIDGGTTWSEVVPIDSNYNSGHTYEYSIAGQGFPAQFRITEFPTNDNYGILMIKIEEM